jgi:NRPS condensation-like uncharacterized protein
MDAGAKSFFSIFPAVLDLFSLFSDRELLSVFASTAYDKIAITESTQYNLDRYKRALNTAVFKSPILAFPNMIQKALSRKPISLF